MDVLSLLVVPGLIGGVLIAASLWLAHRRVTAAGPVPRHDDPILVDAINMAHVPVAGIGGLGFVAAAMITAVLLPTVGASVTIAAVAGVLVAVGLILWRRRGPLPSVAGGAGATLPIESRK